jgi:hypothetical protein
MIMPKPILSKNSLNVTMEKFSWHFFEKKISAKISNPQMSLGSEKQLLLESLGWTEQRWVGGGPTPAPYVRLILVQRNSAGSEEGPHLRRM